MELEAWFDGVCEPVNPGGHAAWGAVVQVEGTAVYSAGGYLGDGPKMSNNVAEYSGCLAAMKFINGMLEQSGELARTLLIRGDSKLVINQLNGQWNINCSKCRRALGSCKCLPRSGIKPCPTPGLYYPFYLDAVRELKALRTRIKTVTLEWIPREKNDICDVLSKKELHDRGIKFRIQPEPPAARGVGRP